MKIMAQKLQKQPMKSLKYHQQIGTASIKLNKKFNFKLSKARLDAAKQNQALLYHVTPVPPDPAFIFSQTLIIIISISCC